MGDSADKTPVERGDTPTPPTALARKFVKYLTGFGVGVAVGLAPYLGKLDVPLFSPLLDLIPLTLQDTILPLSAALMGIVAVTVEWVGFDKHSKAWQKRWFGWTLGVALTAFVSLMVVHTLVVVSVHILGGKGTVSFVVGFDRPYEPPCTREISDAECIKLLTFEPAGIAAFWGDRAIRLSTLAIMIPYLLLMGAFGSLIGLVLLRGQGKKQE